MPVAWRTIQITDRDTKQPITNVQITLEEDGIIMMQTRTDSTGTFVFAGDNETYRLRVSHPEYLAFTTKLRTDDDYHLYVTLRLSKTKRHIMRIQEILIYQPRFSTAHSQRVNQPFQADVNKDECFHKTSCIMQHYSREAIKQEIKGIRLFNEVLVYPNPAVGGVIYVESKFDSKKTLLIYNVAGTEMMRSEIVLHQAIDTSQLPTGIYFLKVIDEKNDDVTVKKIVVP